ncbi:hypothetical protein MRX96_000732 [Rhipicephalus microplus]
MSPRTPVQAVFPAPPRALSGRDRNLSTGAIARIYGAPCARLQTPGCVCSCSSSEMGDGRPLSLGSLRGVPMVASSPVRHEGSDSPQPLEVHAYQPPWKALAEYAMHPNEVDPTTPHFQHLVNQARI